VKDWDKFFEQYSTAAPSEILVQGQPWGYLEELRLGHSLAPGLVFTAPEAGPLAAKEVQPWVELVQTGQFSKETLSKLPLSYQTTDAWLDILQLSAVKFGMTWLHALHIGIALTERGNVAEPILLFQQSMTLFPNPIAARCLAVLQSTSEAAWPFFQESWSLLHKSFKGDSDTYFRITTNLVSEISFFLQQALWYDEIKTFSAAVPETHRDIDAYITMNIKYLMHIQDYEQAQSILAKECFPTYAKARDDLMNTWNLASEGIALKKKGGEAPLNALERHQARKANKIPDNIGCQYASEYCTNYW